MLQTFILNGIAQGVFFICFVSKRKKRFVPYLIIAGRL